MASSRTLDILLHALHDLERSTQEVTDATRDEVAGKALGVLDELDRMSKRWHSKADRGVKKRLGDLNELEGWYRRWLAAAERVDHPALASAIERVRQTVVS
jgi:hypothetical protein